MNQKDFDELVRDTMGEMHQLLVVKGGEYAGSEDRLANFKRGAVLTGATPMQVLFIYLSKHYDAIATYIRDEAAGTTRPRSEGICGRVHDALNYLVLLQALIVEKLDADATVAKQNSAHRSERPEFDPLRRQREVIAEYERRVAGGSEHDLPAVP